MNQEKLGLLIRKKRVEKGLTQEQLACHLGVSPKTVSRWERSLNIPDVSMLESLSLELGISVKDLIVGEETVVQDVDPSILTILYMQKEEIFKIAKKKKIVLICLMISLILFLDISYGYFSTSLSWQISEGIFFPKGIVCTLIFGTDTTSNYQGLLLTQMFYLFLSTLAVNVLLILLYVYLSYIQLKKSMKID